jgi:putative FmdB family regulatory protein
MIFVRVTGFDSCRLSQWGYNQKCSFQRRVCMPIYTYRCETCGVQFDRYQSFNDQPLTTCPECNKKSLRKVIAPVGIVFKGSGWYATDHKSPSGVRNSTQKSESKSDSASESKSEPKESSPAAAESKTTTSTSE